MDSTSLSKTESLRLGQIQMLSVRSKPYIIPEYSLTGDLLSYLTCGLQYRYQNKGTLPPAMPIQLWFGDFIHGVMEEAYLRWDEHDWKDFPWDWETQIRDIELEIDKRMRSRGLQPPANLFCPFKAEDENQGLCPDHNHPHKLVASIRAEAAINTWGPHLFPLIDDSEVKLKGIRDMPHYQKGTSRSNYYGITGIIDVLSSVKLDEASDKNLIIKYLHQNPVFQYKLENLEKPEYEIIVDDPKILQEQYEELQKVIKEREETFEREYKETFNKDSKQEKEEQIREDPYEDKEENTQSIPNPTTKQEIDTTEINDLTIQANNSRKRMRIEFPTTNGVGSILFYKETSTTFRYILNVGQEEIKFAAQKPLWKIGLNNHCPLFKRLTHAFEKMKVYPEFDDEIPKNNLDTLIQQIQLTEYELKKPFEKWKKEETTTKSWAEFRNEMETFTPEMTKKARNILKNGNFLDYAVDTIDLVAVEQKPKATLCFLIAFSSIQEHPLNSLSIASPGKGKSRITENIFKVFPKQRRISFDSESTPAGIARMTQFSEGEQILKGKIVYIGDLGTEKEQEMPNVRSLMSMIKRLMSSQEYVKVLAENKNDEINSTVLSLKGCGAVLVESTAKNPEAQFVDRSVVWSPDDSSEIKNAIRKYQTENLYRIQREHEFKSQRPIVACGIELIYNEIEKYQKNGYKLEIINPYGQQMLNHIFNTESPSLTNRTINHLLEMPKIVALTNFFKKEIWINENLKIISIVVSPKDYVFTINTLGKPLAFMLSPIPENVKSYISMIEKEYFKDYTWNYGYDDYKAGFNKSHPSQGTFDDFILECPSFTNKDIAELMNVSSSTAGGYMDNLDKMSIVYKHFNGSKNLYYPVSNFKEIKESVGIKLVTPEELKEGTELRDLIEKTYENMMFELEKNKFIKKG
ncbi:MAG: hypothetical protein K8E24_007075 [Methanobacterium paludis]|nr:hypothetical protein [Methanobacterium paludis]